MDILINEQHSGKTIRQLLQKDFGYSLGIIRKLKFSCGGILINGEFVTVRYVLREGDTLSLALEDKEEDTSPYIIPVDLPIGIVYEDSDICVADKPPAMPAHPSFGHRLDTAANALAYRYRGTPYVFRPVNRLDRDTSGLMLTANNRVAASKLYNSMTGGEIRKLYLAVVDGKPDEPCGRLVSYMGREEDSIVRRRIVSPDTPGAKKAVTFYKALLSTGRRSVVLASPITGRTHQLRLHFMSIGCPVTGDTLYGVGTPDINRHALHAAMLSFPHPQTGERLTLYAPVPEDICRLIEDAKQVLSGLKEAIDEAAEYFEKERQAEDESIN